MDKFKLTPLQKETLRFFAQNEFGRNFCWTGDTLLAYAYFDHRHSVDLDFFSENLFRDDEYLIFVNELKRKLKLQKVAYTLKNNRRIYSLKKGREVLKIELVYFPFKQIEKKKKLKEFSVYADSLTDIMTNKTLSAYQRKEVKDAYDLYYYLSGKAKLDLVRLTGLVEKKFGISIEISLLIAKIANLLAGFGKLKPLIFDRDRRIKERIEEFFQNEFSSVARKNIK